MMPEKKRAQRKGNGLEQQFCSACGSDMVDNKESISIWMVDRGYDVAVCDAECGVWWFKHLCGVSTDPLWTSVLSEDYTNLDKKGNPTRTWTQRDVG